MERTIIAASTVTVIMILCASLVNAIAWSEILFNPLGADDNKEFVELSGTDDLDGCSIRDAASEDILHTLHNGTDVILIVEDDNILVNTSDATVYGIGKAIGNGLGNSYDEIAIACSNTTILNMSYNITHLNGFTEGHSILFFNETWVVGAMNGTPGMIETEPPKQPPSAPPPAPKPQPQPVQSPSGGGGSGGGMPLCNDTLLLTLGATQGHLGETIQFTILSERYASYIVTANGTPVAQGDTLTTHEHSVTLPETGPVRIAASARSCTGTLHATRYITVLPREELPASEPEEVPPQIAAEAAVATPPVASAPQPLRPAKNGTPSGTKEEIAKTVVFDRDASAIPWISAFGIATVVVSCSLFIHLSRREKPPGDEPPGGKVYKE